MKSRKLFFRLVGGIFVLMALGFGAAAHAGNPTISTVPVVNLPSGEPVAGASSKIIRTDNGITVSVSTTVSPGTYTMWLLVWNNPEDCKGSDSGLGPRCLPGPGGDLPSCILFGAGHVVGEDGTLNLTAHRNTYDATSNRFPAACPNGLTNPRGADVHAAVRTHGEMISGMVAEQIHTFDGGCDTNDCYEVQAAGHEEPLPLD